MLSVRSSVRDCIFGANSEFDKPNLEFRANYAFAGPKNETLGRVAQANGYRTFWAGKWHISAISEVPSAWGFEDYLVVGGNLPTFDSTCFCSKPTSRCFKGHYANPNKLSYNYGCDLRQSPGLQRVYSRNESSALLYARAFDSFLTKVTHSEAFFAVIGFNEPHLPFIASPWVREEILFGRGLAGALSEKEASVAADYYGAIQAMDEAVGQVRAVLRRLKRSEDTLVVFTSDNGPEVLNWSKPAMLGYGSTGGLRGSKRSLFEGGHRVPGILEWPQRIKQNVVSTQVLSMLDVSATILKVIAPPGLFGLLSHKLDGVPIKEFSNQWDRDTPLFLCTSLLLGKKNPCKQVAMIRHNLKLIADTDKGRIAEHSAKLYDYEVSEFLELPRDASEFQPMLQGLKQWAASVLIPSLTTCSKSS
jgi:arylsulfatase A